MQAFRPIVARLGRRVFGNSLYAWIRLRSLQLRSTRRAFRQIYELNLWGATETVSGEGSTLTSSAALRQLLPSLFVELEISSILDAGCGDCNWINGVDLSRVSYIGVDVVEPLIKRNIVFFSAQNCSFLMADITKDLLPRSDLVLCRDCLIHLSNRQVAKALENLKGTGASYLLATTYPRVDTNPDTWPGSFRPLNLQAAPFNLPAPLRVFSESKRNRDGAVIGLWKFADLRINSRNKGRR